MNGNINNNNTNNNGNIQNSNNYNYVNNNSNVQNGNNYNYANNNSNIESTLSNVNQEKQLRNDSANSGRNAGMRSARRDDAKSSLGAPRQEQPFAKTNGTVNSSGKLSNIANNKSSGLTSTSNIKPSFNLPSSGGSKGNNSGLNLKQKIAKEGLKKAATAINPALGALANSKVGDKIINSALKNKKAGIGSMSPLNMLPTDSNGKKVDEDGKDIEEKQGENRLENVTVTISKKMVKYLIPVTCACAVIMFGICIIMVAAQSYISIIGMDLSGSIDDANIESKLVSGQTNLSSERINNDLSGDSGSTSTGSTSTGSATIVNAQSGGFKKKIYYYNQYDYNNVAYGSFGTIGSHGCGPTSLAIAISSILQEEHSPVELTNYMCEHDRCTKSGAPWSGVLDTEIEYAQKYGFKATSVTDLSKLREMLSKGNALAVTITNGGFYTNSGNLISNGGHYFVLTGVDSNGDVTIADPANANNTGRTVNLDNLASNNHNSSSAPSFYVVYR